MSGSAGELAPASDGRLPRSPVSATVYDNTIASDFFGVYDTAGPGLTHFGNHFVKAVVD